MEKLLGGSPFAVILRLAVLSIIVGIVLAALGLQPIDIVNGVRVLFDRLYDMGLGAVETVLGYLLAGAVIVVPVWLIARLLGAGRERL